MSVCRAVRSSSANSSDLFELAARLARVCLASAMALRISSSILRSEPASPASFILSKMRLQQPEEDAAFRGREFALDEFAQQLLLARHRLGADDVRAGDAGAVRRLEAEPLPGALGPQPEGEPGDLRAARVDVDAVEVVLDDEAGHVAQEGGLVGIGVVQGLHRRARRLRRFRADVFRREFPGFVVDDLEQVEGVEAEVHRAAGGIEHPDVARVFERTMRDVDGLLEQLFLARAFSLRRQLRSDSPGFRKISVGRRTR